MRSKAVVGNWKLNGSLGGNESLLKELLSEIGREPLSVACAVCVPTPYLWQVRALLEGSGIAWGAQDVSRFEKGAYTGEVAGAMLVEHGCRYAIVGHSERRTIFGEPDEIVAEKYVAARKAGLTAIFCVGETLEERDKGVTESVLARQVDALVGKYGAVGLDGASSPTSRSGRSARAGRRRRSRQKKHMRSSAAGSRSGNPGSPRGFPSCTAAA